MNTGHRWIEHTADWALELWAESLSELLIEGARAIVAHLVEGQPVEACAARQLTVDSIDDEDLLVRWLNEVLWLAQGEGFLVASATVERAEHGLVAEVRGEEHAAHKLRAEIKAVTYHELSVSRDTQGSYVARVVLDV